MKPTAIGVAAALIFSHSALAHTPQITVTATKVPTSIERVNSVVEVIDRAQIEARNYQSTAQILADYVGVEMATNGGRGQLTSLFMRGANSNHAIVLLDGVNITADIGQAPLEFINPDAIERIEIVKGANASLYGASAMGGVINIVTKNKQRGFHGRVNQSIGSEKSSASGLALNYQSDTGYIHFNASSSQSEGISAQAKPDDKDGYLSNNFYLQSGAYIGKHTVGIQLIKNYANTEYDVFDPTKSAAQHLDVDSFGVQHQYEGEDLSVASHLSHSINALSQIGEVNNGQSAATYKDDFASTATWRINSHHQALLGIEWQRARINNLDKNSEQNSIFAQYVFDNQQYRALVAARSSDYNSFGRQQTANVQLAYNPLAPIQIFASAATAFHAPSLGQLYGPWGANADLKPEELTTYEAGLQWSHGVNRLKLTYFDMDFENLITGVAPSWKNININQASNQGFELNYNLQLGQDLDFYIEYLSQDPIDKTTQKPLLRRAKTQAKTGLFYHWQGLSAHLGVVHSGKRVDFGDYDLAAYTLINAALGYEFNNGVKLQLSGENIGNETYTYAKGYNNPKATYNLNLRWRF